MDRAFMLQAFPLVFPVRPVEDHAAVAPVQEFAAAAQAEPLGRDDRLVAVDAEGNELRLQVREVPQPARVVFEPLDVPPPAGRVMFYGGYAVQQPENYEPPEVGLETKLCPIPAGPALDRLLEELSEEQIKDLKETGRLHVHGQRADWILTAYGEVAYVRDGNVIGLCVHMLLNRTERFRGRHYPVAEKLLAFKRIIEANDSLVFDRGYPGHGLRV